MLYKGKILKSSMPILYGMPSFEKVPKKKEVDSIDLERMAEKVERDAYEKGFAAGEKAGLEMGEQKAAVLLNKLEYLIKEIESMKKNIIKEIEPQVFELSVIIAKKIITQELSTKPELIVEIVKEALQKLERTGPVQIRINPSVYDLFQRLKPDLLDIHPEITFDIDPVTPPTGAIIIGANEEIDTDINSQLKNIVEDMGGDFDPD